MRRHPADIPSITALGLLFQQKSKVNSRCLGSRPSKSAGCHPHRQATRWADFEYIAILMPCSPQAGSARAAGLVVLDPGHPRGPVGSRRQIRLAEPGCWQLGRGRSRSTADRDGTRAKDGPHPSPRNPGERGNGDRPSGKFSPRWQRDNGPGTYMEERGFALIDRIESGQDTTFNLTSHFSPSVGAVLVADCRPTTRAGWVSKSCSGLQVSQGRHRVHG